MDFGIETYEGLTTEDFLLPRMKQPVLSGKKVTQPKIYVGLPKWGRSEWVGKLYPPLTKEKDFLDHYVQHFNSIEFNATHYKVSSAAEIQKWKDKAGDRDFLFCAKMYQGITHRGSLKGKEFITDMFFKSIVAFEKYLGPIFIQVSETFSPKRKGEMYDFLKKLPQNYSYFMEVRHRDWFLKEEILEELSQLLSELKIGFIITDTPNRRDVVHMKLTIPQTFVRFVCFGDHELDKFRLDQWIKQLKQWFQNGLETCYFFLHVRNPNHAVELTKYVQEQLKV